MISNMSPFSHKTSNGRLQRIASINTLQLHPLGYSRNFPSLGEDSWKSLHFCLNHNVLIFGHINMNLKEKNCSRAKIQELCFMSTNHCNNQKGYYQIDYPLTYNTPSPDFQISQYFDYSHPVGTTRI